MHRILSPGLIAFSLLLGLTGCSAFGGKAAEEPSHRVTLQDGDFEIREYLPYAVAETTIPAPFDDAVDTGFGRLFKYISGDNRIDVKIDMTAPVVTEPASQEIAMTAPVLVESKADIGGAGKADLRTEMTDGWRISFVLPSGYTAETAPEPKDPNVSLRDIDKRQIAAIRFSGQFRNEVAEENRQRLANWLESRGLAHFGDWKFAGYNPPWTIPALRRNEVMVTLR